MNELDRQITCLVIPIFSTSSIISSSLSVAITHEIPKAECISNAYGNTKYDYKRVQNSFGNMRCADWVGGTCKVNTFGNIICGLPVPSD